MTGAAPGPRAPVLVVNPNSSAAVIVCWSQPGLDLARSLRGAPVIGIQDARIMTALALADTFGVVAGSPLSIPRHWRVLRRLGVGGRLAGEVATDGVGVEDSGHGEDSYAALLGPTSASAR